MYKIPLTVYSSKIPVHITGFEWGNFTVNALLFHTRLFKNTCEQNTFCPIYIYQFHLCIGCLNLTMNTFP